MNHRVRLELPGTLPATGYVAVAGAASLRSRTGMVWLVPAALPITVCRDVCHTMCRTMSLLLEVGFALAPPQGIVTLTTGIQNTLEMCSKLDNFLVNR